MKFLIIEEIDLFKNNPRSLPCKNKCVANQVNVNDVTWGEEVDDQHL